MTTQLPFTFFDCDNHYYEALDAFTRHIDPQYKKRAIQWAQLDGRQRLLVGGRVNRFIPNPTFDPVGKPGALDEYFRGRNPKGADLNALFGDLEPIPAAYRDRDTRLALMDDQGMAGCILLPTLGVGMEQALLPDLDATVATFRAFNRWMDEDWGFAYQERIFGAPYITLCKPDDAVRELEWALERDARFIVMIPGPITTDVGMRAPGDPMFDAFWQLANDSGVTVCYHSGETYYSKFMPAWGESDYMMSFQALLGFRSLFSGDALQDTFANHLHKGLFLRFPNLRMACIESGSTWVFHLFEKLTKSYGQIPQMYKEDPRETFKRHVWVSPFYEDELASLLKLLGDKRIVMGSDYPHVEGLNEPASYIKDLENFDYTPEQCRTVMRRQRTRAVDPPARVTDIGGSMAKPQLAQGFDFTDPDVYAACLPTEELRELRRAAPVWWNEQPEGVGGFTDGGYWVVSRHRDVRDVSRRSDEFSSAQTCIVPVPAR